MFDRVMNLLLILVLLKVYIYLFRLVYKQKEKLFLKCSFVENLNLSQFTVSGIFSVFSEYLYFSIFFIVTNIYPPIH